MNMKGMKTISSYNLLDESWLNVIDDNNQLQKISLIEIFDHAHQYKRLSGDTAPQDFAVLRLLLAILQTTYMRYQIDGTKQTGNNKDLQNTWRELWENHQFPMKTINDYLNHWKDRFYLYDDQYPFFQVTQTDLDKYVLNQPESKNPGHIDAKLINRIMSESNNKIDLFAPTTDKYKNKLTDDMLARWLVTFIGYTGTSDKSKFPEMKKTGESASRGWLLGLGSIYLQGDNLFETLMLNLILDEYQEQTPVWESNVEEKMNLSRIRHPRNLADLYTNCSRLLVIDPNTDLSKDDVDIQAIQLPGIDVRDGLLEPMSLWRKNKQEEIIPRPHNSNQSLWQSFGLLSNLDSVKRPKIIDWYRNKMVRRTIDKNMVKIVAVGMTRNHDASSMPNGEIYDELNIHKEILNDVGNSNKWANRINDEVELTQEAIRDLKHFANDLTQIRNNATFTMKKQGNSVLADEIEQKAYFKIDIPFKTWIANIDMDTNYRLYPKKWRVQLYRLLKTQADSLIYPLTIRDLKGIPNDKTNSMENAITLYMKFTGLLKKTLRLNGGK